MKKEFLQYYRENGVRYPGDLIRLTNFQLNQFSRGAVLHVYDDGDGHYDIDVSKPYFQGYQKRIVTEIISDYALKEGSLRPVTGSLNDAMSPWRRKNAKMFQVEHDLSVFKLGSDQLAVVNYGYLDFSYKYMPNISMPYYHWKNTYWTVFSHMDALAESMQRQQYIFIQLPKALQGVTVLTRYQDRAYTQTMMEIFGKPTTDGFMQLDIWRWLNPETRRFSILNVIRKKNFDKINLVFQGSTGKQVLVNLGFLNSWIKGQENQTFMSSVTQVSALNLQKLFLKMALTLNDIEVVEGQEALEVIEGQPSAPAQENENIAEVTLPSDDVSDALGEQHDELADMYRKLSKLKADEKHTVPTKQKEVADKDDKHVKELIHDIEDDLKALDLVSLAQVKNKGVKINEEATAVAAPVSNTAEPPEPPEDEVEPMTKEEIDSYLYRKAPSEQVVMSKLAEAA